MRGNILRGELAVQGRMPLSGQRWVQPSQAVIIAYSESGTVRAADPPTSAVNTSLPHMPFWAYPPDILSGVQGNILWSELAVHGRMPLPSQRWVQPGQAVIIAYRLSATVRAAGSVASAGNYRPPFMAFWA